MTEGQRAEWANYRRALLNVPQQETFPNVEAIIWPTKPE